jgi:hypothetical protein
MFYEDLSPYQYSYVPTGLPGVFNIGWLSSHATISRGDVAPAARLKLAQLSDPPVFPTYGSHLCDFCWRFRRNGEVWIPGDDGCVYASPLMLLHYIEQHNYLPPAVFLEALHRAKAALTEDECDARIYAHRHKLDTAPTPEDILVPFYSVKIFWKLSDFRDLTAFCKVMGSGSGRFRHFAVNDIGYFVRTECERPDELLRQLVAQYQRSKRIPFRCTFKLLYVGGEEQVIAVETPRETLQQTSWWRRLRGRISARD